MTPTLSKFVFVMLAVGWYIIRYKYARRSARTPVLRSDRGLRETALLLISLTGLGVLPFLYVSTGMPHFADYTFHPVQAWLGLLFAIASLIMFQLSHRALGRNWSVSLDVRVDHQLITDGIYQSVRHPMYTAFWLWALAQALLLPNWVARVLRHSRFRSFVFWPSFERRTDYAGHVRRSVSRLHGAYLPDLTENLLKQRHMSRNPDRNRAISATFSQKSSKIAMANAPLIASQRRWA